MNCKKTKFEFDFKFGIVKIIQQYFQIFPVME